MPVSPILKQKKNTCWKVSATSHGRQPWRKVILLSHRQHALSVKPGRNADKEANNTHSCRHQLVHSILVGRTPIGERVWDMSRLIDWATANLPVDAERIAITGNSGGGTVSLFAAACETRIAVAVPSCYFCTFEGSIGMIRHWRMQLCAGRNATWRDVRCRRSNRAASVLCGCRTR